MKLSLKSKQKEVGNIWSFFFEPQETITWLAGQSIRLELPRATWGIDERRFSIASAPHEKHIQITTRISKSNFKEALKKLKVGDTIEGLAIEGEFLWGKSEVPRLFLAGGIGITAFRSLIAQALYQKIPLNATMMYSFSDKKALFKKELSAWQAQDPTFYVRYLPQKRIELDSHSTLSPFWRDNLIYISGPEKMVNKLAMTLLKQGVQQSQLKLDQFTGDVSV